ncbi:MAG: FliI/YscN family ATPase [Candidatus Melainabacteria bacterium]|nr:FliI/YscN family ATPase [Candidatus Melainabacteria bacterium]MBI3307879.1 FliI/YscN family ATPase [Candidatus Melainabacteria bacterium]
MNNLHIAVKETLEKREIRKWTGYVNKVVGLLLEAKLPGAMVGELCQVITDQGEVKPAEVVGFRGDISLLLLLVDGRGVHQGSKIIQTGRLLEVMVGDPLLGRVVDTFGKPLDNKELNIEELVPRPLDAEPPEAFGRPRIDTVFSTGTRAIDGLLTLGVGQRIGIFAGSGVGKSTLLGMIARYGDADVNVIALVGERGREVQDFIEVSLGEEGLKKSVVIVATSDQPAMLRVKCLFTATTIAEYFRDQGKNVLLMADSVTRLAMSARDVGLSVGEPPTMKGYTPSVFAMLPRILERSGRSKTGAITAIYTVLVEGDDFNEPIADAVRGILDGHIILSRHIAARNHFPSVDVLSSVSRLFPEIASKEHQQAAGFIRNMMATYNNAEDLIAIGAYEKGSDPRIDKAVALKPVIDSFLQQGIFETTNFEETQKLLQEINNQGN